MSKAGLRGLGRGFDALLPQDFDNSILMDESERIQKLALTAVMANPDQPRKNFDQTALAELASSIEQYGILQPIVVTPVSGGKYSIIAGERRFRAAKLANLTTIPAIVRTTEELERLEIALVENVQRVDLSPLEQAASILRLREQFNIDYETIAKRLGKAQTTISNIVRLLNLPKAAQEALKDGKITEGHARAVLAFKDEAKQLELLELIITKHWNVRQAEQYVTAHKSGVKDIEKARERVATSTPETEKLSHILAAPVTIKRTARGGKLEIAFTTEEEFTRIINLLSSK